MHDTFNLLTVQTELGYVFKDPNIIKTAFTHRSYDTKNTQSNVGLIFLGKELISFVLCDYITSRLTYASEKQISYQVESYFSSMGMSNFIKTHSLSKFVMLGSLNEPMRNGDTIATELFYAISAAIYRDGGLSSLKSFLMPLIRACGGDDHYQPSIDGQVLLTAEQAQDNEQHIKSQRLRKPAKNGSIGMSKADTLNSVQAEKNTRHENKKQEKGISRLLSRKKKLEKSPQQVSEPENEAPTQTTEKKFIRDPFAPVKLSDELRNFKPKKPSKYDTAPQKTEPQRVEPATEQPKAVHNEFDSDDKNYKSLLQEFVQKNLRTANVLIKYTSAQINKDTWQSNLLIDGNRIATSTAQNKKDAEKSAAKDALKLLSNKSSSEHKWFTSLSGSEITDTGMSADYISRLNQYMQKKLRASYAPIVYERTKNKDKKGFTVNAVCNGEVIGSATATDPKEAKQLAAKNACQKLGI